MILAEAAEVRAVSFLRELKRRNVLRVGAAYVALSWLLIQVAETLFPVFAFSNAAMRAVVVALAIGLIPVLIASWAFELTPEGPRPDTGNAPSTFSVRIAKRLDRTIMVMLALGLAYFAFDKFVVDPARDQALQEAAREAGRNEGRLQSYGEKSIAVLVFENVSPDAEQVYFATGVAEEILNLLAEVPELRVISRNSSFGLSDSELSTLEIAERLDVSYVLTGSVRRADDDVRITTRLVDAETDTQIWSEAYDETLTDVFALQDRIARKVIDALKIRLLGQAPKSRETNSETWTLMLQARHLVRWGSGGSGRLDEAESLIKRALALDPDYVPALNLLSRVYFDSAGSRYTPQEAFRLAWETNDRVLSLDPDNASASAGRAFRYFFFENNLAGAVPLLETALRNAPHDDTVLFVASSFAGLIGHFDDSIALGTYAVARDPLCYECMIRLEKAYVSSGRLADAESLVRRRQSLISGGWFSLGYILLLQGDPRAALEACSQQTEPAFAWHECEAMALHDLGDEAGSRRAFSDLMKIEADQSAAPRNREQVPYRIARYYVHTGQSELAMAFLAERVDTRNPQSRLVFSSSFLWDPILSRLDDHPQWQELRQNAGLGAERLASIELKLPSVIRGEHRQGTARP
jgi:TolB-like protein